MSAKKTSQAKAPKAKKATETEAMAVLPPPEATPTTEAPAKTKAPKAKAEPSALDAAAKVLGEQGKSMNCQEMIEEMSKKKYWTSPNGAIPFNFPTEGNLS